MALPESDVLQNCSHSTRGAGVGGGGTHQVLFVSWMPALGYGACFSLSLCAPKERALIRFSGRSGISQRNKRVNSKIA